MLGPLPTAHRVVVALCAFAAFIGLGIWLAVTLAGDPMAGGAAGVGAGLGLVATLLLVHDFSHPRAAHAPRHRGPRRS